MLQYLDNQQNRKCNINENLARELLELFSMGVGNYSEQDIKEVAQVLTGHGLKLSSGVDRFKLDLLKIAVIT